MKKSEKEKKESLDDVFNGANKFVESGSDVVNGNSEDSRRINQENLKSTSQFIFKSLLAIAIVIAVIVGMILGIKLMLSGVEEKAKYKELMLPYLISCIVVFGAFGIWSMLVNILAKW